MKSYSVRSTSLNRDKNGGSGGYYIKYKTMTKYDNYGNASITSTICILGREPIQSVWRPRYLFTSILRSTPFSVAVVDDWKQFQSRREPTRKGSTRLDRRGNLNRQTHQSKSTRAESPQILELDRQGISPRTDCDLT
jgi:hypothetical protein